MQPTKWQIQLILSQEIIFLSFIEITERNGSFCASHSYSLWLSLAQKALARLATSQLRSSSLSHSGIDIPHICRQRHQQRWCKNLKVRGIFSIFNVEGTPVESCRMCVISHTVSNCSVCVVHTMSNCSPSVQFYTICVILHTVCNSTQYIISNTVCNSTQNVDFTHSV